MVSIIFLFILVTDVESVQRQNMIFGHTEPDTKSHQFLLRYNQDLSRNQTSQSVDTPRNISTSNIQKSSNLTVQQVQHSSINNSSENGGLAEGTADGVMLTPHDPSTTHDHLQTIAIGFHGNFERKGTLGDPTSCSNFFLVAEEISDKLIRPLKQNYNVQIFWHTYKDLQCTEMDNALVRYLQPVAYEFSSSPLPQIVDSYIRVIDLITKKSNASLPEFIILARFDVVYRVPFTDFNLHLDKVNLPFRDPETNWNSFRMVSDLFFVVPAGFVAPFRKSLEESCSTPGAMELRATYARRRIRGTPCPAHYFYPALGKAIGEKNIHFIDDAFRSSNIRATNDSTSAGELNGLQKSQYEVNREAFLGIYRVCGGWSSDSMNYTCPKVIIRWKPPTSRRYGSKNKDKHIPQTHAAKKIKTMNVLCGAPPHRHPC